MVELSAEERTKCFLKMGFWEERISEKTLSCGVCKTAVPATECEQKIFEMTESRFYSKGLNLVCPKCNSVLLGAVI